MKKIDTSNMKWTLTSSARTGFSPLLFGQCLFPDELFNFSADSFSNIFWAFQRWPNEEHSPNIWCMSSELPSLFHPIPLPLSWLEWGITETTDEKIKSQDTVSPTYCTHSSSSTSSISTESICLHFVATEYTSFSLQVSLQNWLNISVYSNLICSNFSLSCHVEAFQVVEEE